MKALLSVILVLFAASSFAQINFGRENQAIPLLNIKTYTTFTATSDDTTGFISSGIPGMGGEILLAQYVAFTAIVTDTCQTAIQFIGTNSQNALVKTVFADSVSTIGFGVPSAAAPYVKTIVLKSPTLDRLAGCTQVRIGTVFSAAVALKTTAGRTFKWYLTLVE